MNKQLTLIYIQHISKPLSGKKKTTIQFIILALLLGHSFIGSAQIFPNPSFESIPKEGIAPDGWQGCHRFSTPDTQPGFWEVSTAPSDGFSYIGLVTRGNLGPFANENEDVQTQLLKPFVKDKTFELSIDLAFAPQWGHFIGFSSDFLKYDNPAKLQVWGAKDPCIEAELLWESPLINHQEWKKYSFSLQPVKTDIHYLILQASHAGSSSYFGNILIDNIDIDPCSFVAPITTQAYDTLICPGDPVILDANTTEGTYLWESGSSEATIEVEEAGVYTVEVSNGCQTESFSFEVTERTATVRLPLPTLSVLTVTIPMNFLKYQAHQLSLDSI